MSPKQKARLAAQVAEDMRAAAKDPNIACTLEKGGRAQVREVCPTGSMVLDQYVLGVGGMPWGRIIEVSGSESSGKTTFVCRLMAEAQRDGALPILSDKENKFHTGWASVHTLHLGDCVEYDADTIEAYGEEALRLITKYGLRKRAPVKLMFVLDSVAALDPRALFESNLEEHDIPGAAGLAWSRTLRKLSRPILQGQAMLVLINQMRDKIGVTFGKKSDTPSGRAIKHYSSIRMKVWPGDQIKKGDAVIGRYINMLTFKNNLTGIQEPVELKMLNATGFDDRWSVLNFAKKTGAIGKEAADKDYDEALANLGWADKVRRT